MKTTCKHCGRENEIDEAHRCECGEPVCPGPVCLMCSGEACNKCGAGCWNNNPKQPCEHDVIERHEEPDFSFV